MFPVFVGPLGGREPGVVATSKNDKLGRSCQPSTVSGRDATSSVCAMLLRACQATSPWIHG